MRLLRQIAEHSAPTRQSRLDCGFRNIKQRSDLSLAESLRGLKDEWLGVLGRQLREKRERLTRVTRNGIGRRRNATGLSQCVHRSRFNSATARVHPRHIDGDHTQPTTNACSISKVVRLRHQCRRNLLQEIVEVNAARRMCRQHRSNPPTVRAPNLCDRIPIAFGRSQKEPLLTQIVYLRRIKVRITPRARSTAIQLSGAVGRSAEGGIA